MVEKTVLRQFCDMLLELQFVVLFTNLDENSLSTW